MSTLTAGWQRRLVLNLLRRIRHGRLELFCEGTRHVFGDPASNLHARIDVHRERFFTRLLWEGDAGAGSSFVGGDWSSPDLVSLIRLAVRNLEVLEGGNRVFSAVSRSVHTWRHRRRGNTLSGSRENIRKHYDLSNAMYALFLDANMQYSCAVFEPGVDSLHEAQTHKMDRICRKLGLGPGDHVLEIGCGWGGLARHMARHYGCRVTATTISREQYRYAKDLLRGENVDLLLEDYRKLQGQYGKIVSIEMFEAVGLVHYDEFFGACDRLLAPGGSMLLQTIAIQDRKFEAYRREADWIQQMIFPGGELASVREILNSLARVTGMHLDGAEEIGLHYARTLNHWRTRFLARLNEVYQLGFDDRFARLWTYYLSYCEGAFLERHVLTYQLILAKSGVPVATRTRKSLSLARATSR
jgi:cyclopropane-fatty-acyl-phospholipid synthase